MDSKRKKNKRHVNASRKKSEKKELILKKIDSLSWFMGKRQSTSREELYDR